MPLPSRYLVLFLLFFGGNAFADLPGDADRSIDVELAGFLYSQGVYKKRTGHFAELDQKARDSSGIQNETESLVFPDRSESSSSIESWLKETHHSISLQEMMTE